MKNSTAIKVGATAALTVLAVALGWHYRDSFKMRTSPAVLQSRQSGTLFYDRLRSQDGYNVLDVSTADFSCDVYSMTGAKVYRFPGGFCSFLRDGAFFSTNRDMYFYGADGRLLWHKPGDVHHDVSFSEDEKEIFVISDERETIDGRKVGVEKILGYSRGGDEIFRWSSEELHDRVRQMFSDKDLYFQDPGSDDYHVTHFNSVQVLPANDLEATYPAFRRGNILVNCYHFAFVFILDRQTHQIVWSHRFSKHIWLGAHAVRMEKNGNLLYFLNNAGKYPHYHSEIQIYDPRQDKVIWSYKGDPPGTFVIDRHGSVERMENGNLLVTHFTTGGSAFEITPEGRLVWEWVYPAKQDNGMAWPIYRLNRVSRQRVDRVIREWKTF